VTSTACLTGSMTTDEALEDLALELAGNGWKHKFAEEWTPLDRRAYEQVKRIAEGKGPAAQAAQTALDEWLLWWMTEPCACSAVWEGQETMFPGENPVGYTAYRLEHLGTVISEPVLMHYRYRPDLMPDGYVWNPPNYREHVPKVGDLVSLLPMNRRVRTEE
jgi:hypothetical protein